MSPFELLDSWLNISRQPYVCLAVGIAVLLAAGELVVVVLGKLEDKNFGVVHLGTLFTPLCTGFPNLMLGVFGQERLTGDLVIHLNLGNNIANTTLVVGTIIFVTGPLLVRVAKGKSKTAKKKRADFHLAVFFLWVGAALLFGTAMDGVVTRRDGLLLFSCYACYQLLMLLRRGSPPKKKRLSPVLGAGLLFLLFLCALLISFSVDAVSAGMENLGALVPGESLGMLLGLLTVLPESFLLMRLARKQGSLGLSGLVGDCLVSIPLVIGLSAMIKPITTAAVTHWSNPAAVPYINLVLGMTAFTLLAQKQQPVSRKLGLFFMSLYVMVWLNPVGRIFAAMS